MKPLADFPLDSMNTLGVKSKAEYFYSFGSVEELEHVIGWARSHNQPLRLLGGGSNVLLEPDVSGLILQSAILGKHCVRDTESQVWLKVGAGENWHDFTQWSIQNGYCGLENLSLIPGLVGASPIQNIGAYGVEVSSLIESVEVYDLEQNQLRTLNKMECEFAYRDSIFKRSEGRALIVLNITFVLDKSPSVNISYPVLQQHFENANIAKPSARDVANAVIEIRQNKLPSPSETPNVGSFFKNPVVDEDQLSQLLKLHPEMPHYTHGALYKIAAAWLIDQAGWKGKAIAGVAVHHQQALVVVNPEHQNLDVILGFASEVQRDIQQKFGISLEIEPQCLASIELDRSAAW